MKLIFICSTKWHKVPLYELIRYLASKEHEINIIQPKGILDKKSVKEDNISYLNSIFLPKIRYTIPNLIEEYFILSKLLKRNYDIIQISDYFYPTIFPPIFIKKMKKIPLIIVSNAIVGTNWKYGSKYVDLVGKFYTKTFSRYIFNSADKLVFLYKKLSKIAEEIGASYEKIETIPNGVDINRFYPKNKQRMREKLGINLDSKVIISVGRLVPVKRVELLIKITRKLLEEDRNIKTYYIGDGPYRSYYKSLAEDIKDNFIFLGRKPHGKIPEYLSAADVFVLPSLSEGFPSSILEAGACGLPVIASNVGGVSEIIKHEKTGYIVSNEKDFTFYVKKALEKKYNRNKLHEEISKRFSWEKIVEKYEKMYEELI